ncbi:MAG: hypothetical protein WD468_06915 [Pirellulales bacterium]
MIPPFDQSGYLPPGIHPATLDEIVARFGHLSEIRRVQLESIRWMVELATTAGIQRIILNGSFVTDIMEPNDVDCILLGAESAIDPNAELELLQGLPFLEISLVDPDDFNELVNETFASDRFGAPKG